MPVYGKIMIDSPLVQSGHLIWIPGYQANTNGV